MIEVRGELYATTTEAAAQLAHVGVTPQRIRDWHRRGLITPAHTDGRRYWWRMRDIWDAEHATRTRGRRRNLTTHAA